MIATREHLAGLELAHKTIAPYSSWCGEQLRLLVEQAKAAPQAEPVGSVYTMEPLVPGGEIVSHASLFHSLPGGTQLYAHQPTPDHAEQVRALVKVLERCQEHLHPHRDAVLWGDVCDALSSQRVKP